jgi:hypothetical protein
MSCPMPKFLGLFPDRRFTTYLAICFFLTPEARVTFFPLAAFFLASWVAGRKRANFCPYEFDYSE